MLAVRGEVLVLLNLPALEMLKMPSMAWTDPF